VGGTPGSETPGVAINVGRGGSVGVGGSVGTGARVNVGRGRSGVGVGATVGRGVGVALVPACG
jgi:hypothetical protein